MRELRGKVGVVTGAASGIGRAVAEAFAAEGMRVALADVDGARLDAEVDRLLDSGVEAIGVVTDVGDQAAVDELARRTVERFGGVHVVCNNAGVVGMGRTWELSLEDWNRVLRVNLWGVIHGVRAFVPLLLDSGEEGHVVNVASMAAVVPVPGIAPYNVSKHGVLALSETLHRELTEAGSSVGVSVVMPGFVQTGLGRPGAAEDAAPPTGPDEVGPDDVARCVVDAVRGRQLFVFTHPDRLDDVRRRFAGILPPP